MTVTAEQVKELRARSGAGMMACKKALAECDGDLETALDALRKSGEASAAKKAGRETREGAVAVAVNGNAGVLVELNCETDFVARTEAFSKLAHSFATTALDKGISSVEALLDAEGESGKVSEQLVAAIAELGENAKISQVAHLKAEDGAVTAYVHNKYSESVGKIGVLVALQGSKDSATDEFAKMLAMHVAASAPLALDGDSLAAEIVARERKVQEGIIAEQGKPAEVATKILEGKMRRFYEQSCLLDQPWVLEPKQKVKEALAEAGSGLSIVGFARLALGEGGEKPSATE